MYTPTVWREHSMSAAQKVDGLNNLENMYTETVAYISAITHSERYYDKNTCDAKYFTTANDGSGSNFVALTLDGYTAQQIIDAGTPSGCIAVWSGSVGTIPSGWHLCDGLSGTPNLQSKFVIGAGGSYSQGSTGGTATVTPTATVTIATFALEATHLPSHTHSYADYYTTNPLGGPSGVGGAPVDHSGYYTDDAGTSTAHGHPGSTFSGNSCNILPKYYALAFIMKL